MDPGPRGRRRLRRRRYVALLVGERVCQFPDERLTPPPPPPVRPLALNTFRVSHRRLPDQNAKSRPARDDLNFGTIVIFFTAREHVPPPLVVELLWFMNIADVEVIRFAHAPAVPREYVCVGHFIIYASTSSYVMYCCEMNVSIRFRNGRMKQRKKYINSNENPASFVETVLGRGKKRAKIPDWWLRDDPVSVN